MTDASDKDATERPSLLQMAVLVISVYVLVALFVQTVFHLPAEIENVLDTVDSFVCLVFLADFIVRFRNAPSKIVFMRWGWIDLLSSIPSVAVLRWGRVIRVIRIFRILRAFRSAKNLAHFLFLNRSKGTLLTVALGATLLLIFASVAILTFETGPDARIKNSEDALWWAFATITTVGYGDLYPVTSEGRIVAVILMISGIALFGTFTAFVAQFLVSPQIKKEDQDIRELIGEVRLLREQVAAMAKTNAENGSDAKTL